MANIFYTFKKRVEHRGSLLSSCQLCQILIVFLMVSSVALAQPNLNPKKPKTVTQLMGDLKDTMVKRKFNWDLSFLTDKGWQSHGYTVQDYPMIYYTCGEPKSENVSLILSAVHGDEVTPLYFGFRLVEWLKARPHLCKNRFIVVAPVVNPDGFMRYSRGTRSNYHKVDLNRNFDTPDWDKMALHLWRTKYKERRYYPGEKSASEPETHFQKWLIDEFHPAKILSVHAPLNILDYDGPQTEEAVVFNKTYVAACEDLKSAVRNEANTLRFYAYGVFPGSLGNYAGKQRGIPTFTVELPTIKPDLAGKYFSDLEKGTELFITYELKEYQPLRQTNRN